MSTPNAPSVRDDQALERIIREGNRSRDIARLRERGDSPWWWNWLRLGDGTCLSVIAGSGAYCSPSDDGPFLSVEVWWPGDDEPSARVPVDYLRRYVAEHGGIIGVAEREEAARGLT